jgi:hypothetical protein
MTFPAKSEHALLAVNATLNRILEKTEKKDQ